MGDQAGRLRAAAWRMASPKGAFTGWPLFIEMALTFVHMMSMVIVIPGMWTYVKGMGGTTNWLGWCFAAYPIGAWLATRQLRDTPLGPIEEIKKASDADLDKRGKTKRSRRPATPRWIFVLLILVGIGGNIFYGFASHPAMVIAARVLSGICGGAMVISHKFIEFSTNADDTMLRSRMVLFGAVQAAGTVTGVFCAVGLSAIPPFAVAGYTIAGQALCGWVIALLYIILLPGLWNTYKPIEKELWDHVDASKGEMDAPPNNYMAAQKLGVLVPAIVYDRGQARPSSLPDVFSTAVLLVVYFLLTNLMVGIEVAHGPFCEDVFKWDALDTSITYSALIIAGLVGIVLNLSVSDEVPCNRRLFGALVLTFVTYGVMLQPSTPKEQYIGFLVLIACCFYICDLALTEIYIDKIGEEDSPRMTAAGKLTFMNWLNQTATFTRILGAIVSGYVYDYYSEPNHVTRRPYAVYGCGFGVALLLVVMCMIFYKRFQMRSMEQQMLQSDKLPLQPQQINCMEDV